MPKKAKSKAKSKAKLNLKKSKKGRRAAPPKRRKVAVSIPVLEEIKHRNETFRGGRPFPEIGGRIVILVDDGLASGYTMMASINFVRERKPSRIVVAVPTAPESSVQFLSTQVDELLCLNIRRGFFFAVADAYHYWHDLSEEEVMELLTQIGPGDSP